MSDSAVAIIVGCVVGVTFLVASVAFCIAYRREPAAVNQKAMVGSKYGSKYGGSKYGSKNSRYGSKEGSVFDSYVPAGGGGSYGGGSFGGGSYGGGSFGGAPASFGTPGSFHSQSNSSMYPPPQSGYPFAGGAPPPPVRSSNSSRKPSKHVPPPPGMENPSRFYA